MSILAGMSAYNTQLHVISDDEDEVTSNSTPSAVRPIPAQDIMKEKIAKLCVELNLTERRKGSLIADGNEYEKACKLWREIDDCEKKLKLKKKQIVYTNFLFRINDCFNARIDSERIWFF